LIRRRTSSERRGRKGQSATRSRAANDLAAGRRRDRFVSLLPWLIDCFFRRGGPARRLGNQGLELCWHLAFFRLRLLQRPTDAAMREEYPMKSRTLTLLALAAGLFAAGQAIAQQQPAPAAPPAPPDLNAIPDKMPFNIPFGAAITMDRAQA